MKRAVWTFLLALLLAAPRIASAAPITDPNDPRTWQDASLETFRALLGFATLQELVDAQLLDDGVFPTTADYAQHFELPGSPCGLSPHGIAPPAYIGEVQGCLGYSNDPNDPANYTDSCQTVTSADYAECGRCLDMWWVQDTGDGDVTTANVWDLGGPANQVAVFPIVDHGPLPQEAIEYSVFLSNNSSANAVGTDGSTDWVPAKLDKVYLEGWISTWIPDGFTTVWRLPDDQTFRYVNVTSGGPASLQHDGDDEIDAVIGLTFGGEPVCPDITDRDGDGVCDADDNCPDAPNPLQDDRDADGIGDACDNGCQSVLRRSAESSETGATGEAIVGGCDGDDDCGDDNACNGVETCDLGTCQCRAGTPVTCSDGNVCNGIESCAAPSGQCLPGTPLTACPEDADECTVATCDPLAGCGQAPVADGLSCTPTLGCQTGATCLEGECVESFVCEIVVVATVQVVPIKPKQQQVKVEFHGEPKTKCTAQAFVTLPPAEAPTAAATTRAAAKTGGCAKTITKARNKAARQNTTEVAVTTRAKTRIKSNQTSALLGLRLNPIGRCLFADAAGRGEGLIARVRTQVTPKGGETTLLDHLVEVVRNGG